MKNKTQHLMCLSCSVISDFATPWTVAPQAPLSMELSRQEILNWVDIPFSRDLPNPGIKPGSSALQADSLLSGPGGN